MQRQKAKEMFQCLLAPSTTSCTGGAIWEGEGVGRRSSLGAAHRPEALGGLDQEASLSLRWKHRRTGSSHHCSSHAGARGLCGAEVDDQADRGVFDEQRERGEGLDVDDVLRHTCVSLQVSYVCNVCIIISFCTHYFT